MSRRIYLDFNASTPICSEAVEVIRPFLFEHYGNPSSLHWAGIPAKDAVEKARGQVAGFLGCDPTEVVFTSGGSESNNHAIKGVFFAKRDRGNHIQAESLWCANGPCPPVADTLPVGMLGNSASWISPLEIMELTIPVTLV